MKKAITPKTKLLILNSPSNPTGGVATPERLEAIAKLCVEGILYVRSDEVYHRLLYADAPFVSIASFPGMKERTVIIDSFSKTYAMTGWRVGMAPGPESILSMMVKFQENVAACVNTAAQFGALEALCGAQDCVEEMLQTYSQRRKVLVEGLNSIPHLTCIEPKGAFYAFPNITATGLTSQKVPCNCFNPRASSPFLERALVPREKFLSASPMPLPRKIYCAAWKEWKSLSSLWADPCTIIDPKEGYIMRLENKVCIVTGSCKGIGAAIVERFLEEGAVCVVNSRFEKSVQEYFSQRTTAFRNPTFIRSDSPHGHIGRLYFNVRNLCLLYFLLKKIFYKR